MVTKVINVPVLSDNIYCGLSGALFNMTIQNLDNWRRLVQEPISGDPSIPEAYADPRVGDKVVFQIMDGLIALYAGRTDGGRELCRSLWNIVCQQGSGGDGRGRLAANRRMADQSTNGARFKNGKISPDRV